MYVGAWCVYVYGGAHVCRCMCAYVCGGAHVWRCMCVTVCDCVGGDPSCACLCVGGAHVCGDRMEDCTGGLAVRLFITRSAESGRGPFSCGLTCM